MDIDSKFFSERFKQLRIKNGYTQQQMANLFNVTRPCICYWENGKRVPDFLKLADICKFFNVSSDYLLNITNDPKPKIKQEATVYCVDDRHIDFTLLTKESAKKLIEVYDYLIYSQNKQLNKII